MSNFVHIETFILKPSQLLDDRELTENYFEKKPLIIMIFIGFLILESIKLNTNCLHKKGNSCISRSSLSSCASLK